MKSEEILLEEARSEYTRHLSAWTEQNHWSRNFLQLNGLLLSITFIGMGLQRESEGMFVLALSALFFTASAILGVWATRSLTVKEVKVALDGKPDIANKEREIMLTLIKMYHTAKEDVISKYKERRTKLNWSVVLLVIGLTALLAFVLIIAMSIMV